MKTYNTIIIIALGLLLFFNGSSKALSREQLQFEKPLFLHEETSNEFFLSEIDPLVTKITRAAPPVPGETEVLSDVFRTPIGTGPELLTDKLLQLTPPQRSQNGAIWSKEKLNLRRDFHLRVYLYLGDSRAQAADGITFTLQNDSRMTNNPNAVLGDPGMGLGAYSNRSGGNYIRNAISLEFDTFFNNGSSNRMDREIGSNGNRGHIAIVTPKSNNNHYYGEHSAVTLSPDYLSNGRWREIDISWTAASQTFRYDVAGVGSQNYVIRNLVNQFGGEEVYWGFTASTGNFFAENMIAISELPQKIELAATITNLTNQTTPGVSVTAQYQDRLEVNTVITTSTFFNPANYDQGQLKVEMPEGLIFDPTSVRIAGQLVPNQVVQLGTDYLLISNVNLSLNGRTELSLEGNINTPQAKSTLDLKVTLFDAELANIAHSNQLKVEAQKLFTSGRGKYLLSNLTDGRKIT